MRVLLLLFHLCGGVCESGMLVNHGVLADSATLRGPADSGVRLVRYTYIVTSDEVYFDFVALAWSGDRVIVSRSTPWRRTPKREARPPARKASVRVGVGATS